MGTTLTGTTPQDTYDSLIKVTDNGPISGTAKYLSDGLGNDSALALSTSRVGVNAASPTAGLEVITDSSSLNALRVGSSRAYNLSTETAIVFRYLKNTTDFVSGALLVAAKDNTTINNESGNLQFYTNNAGSVGEHMRITSAGNVGIGTTAPAVPLDVVGNIRSSTGILFGSDTAAANALDDYEEGTWTPTVIGTTGVGTYTTQFGIYTKIGRQVVVSWFLEFQKNTISGIVTLAGLPFTLGNYSNVNYPQATIMFDNLASAYNNPLLQLANGNTIATPIINNGTTSSHAGMQETQLGAGTMTFRGTATYFV